MKKSILLIIFTIVTIGITITLVAIGIGHKNSGSNNGGGGGGGNGHVMLKCDDGNMCDITKGDACIQGSCCSKTDQYNQGDNTLCRKAPKPNPPVNPPKPTNPTKSPVNPLPTCNDSSGGNCDPVYNKCAKNYNSNGTLGDKICCENDQLVENGTVCCQYPICGNGECCSPNQASLNGRSQCATDPDNINQTICCAGNYICGEYCCTKAGGCDPTGKKCKS
jgi:hypothetical protein